VGGGCGHTICVELKREVSSSSRMAPEVSKGVEGEAAALRGIWRADCILGTGVVDGGGDKALVTSTLIHNAPASHQSCPKDDAVGQGVLSVDATNPRLNSQHPVPHNVLLGATLGKPLCVVIDAAGLCASPNLQNDPVPLVLQLNTCTCSTTTPKHTHHTCCVHACPPPCLP
jgi:hypothetical protein